MASRKMLSNNTTGVTGVSYHKASEKYRAAIYLDGRQYSLGYFDDLESASAARRQAELDYSKRDVLPTIRPRGRQPKAA